MGNCIIKWMFIITKSFFAVDIVLLSNTGHQHDVAQHKIGVELFFGEISAFQE